jgi:L-asparaginase/Glu-tRNA(Gln) amidotransferase subunit D
MTHRDWARIAEFVTAALPFDADVSPSFLCPLGCACRDIKENYDAYDGFVILHGTDTMAFTCSVLSFMLINLNKTVILTGSQIPLCQQVSCPGVCCSNPPSLLSRYDQSQRNDGESNLLAAMSIAGHYQIPEVCLFFCNKLLRGCRYVDHPSSLLLYVADVVVASFLRNERRSTKRDASALDAFDSPNYPALAHVEIEYDISWEKMLPTPAGDFMIDTRFEHNVSVLTLFPGMKPEVVESQLRPPMRGVVLRAFGAGNAPDNNKAFLEVLRKASERGVVIVAVTQCLSAWKSVLLEGDSMIYAGV